MGASKAAEFSDELNQIANLCKGLGHPARVAIINYLLNNQICTSKDILEELPLSQPTISQHFSMLTFVGLIKGRTINNTVCYQVENKALQILSKYFFLSIDKISEYEEISFKNYLS